MEGSFEFRLFLEEMYFRISSLMLLFLKLLHQTKLSQKRDYAKQCYAMGIMLIDSMLEYRGASEFLHQTKFSQKHTTVNCLSRGCHLCRCTFRRCIHDEIFSETTEKLLFYCLLFSTIYLYRHQKRALHFSRDSAQWQVLNIFIQKHSI